MGDEQAYHYSALLSAASNANLAIAFDFNIVIKRQWQSQEIFSAKETE